MANRPRQTGNDVSPAAPDFIECYPGQLPAAVCADVVARMRQSPQLQPGRVGGGVYPELKHSRDLTLAGHPHWQDVEQTLTQALMQCVVQYLRRYPQALLSPFMLQSQDDAGQPVRLAAEHLQAMDDAALTGLVTTCLRPSAINLQWYRNGEGGYPYWHCELQPRDASAETLHRHLLWTVYLNDGFAEGETEFLFQQRKIVPSTGALLLAPTAFTHTHRGNRPLGGDKFIATGWVLFQRAEVLFGGG